MDRSRPLVSVITPAYNAAATIEATLRSALDQTYDHLEILVVDDGSTDETVAIVQDMQDNRLCLIQQSNQGVAAARNRAIAEARGSLIAPLDADDIWYPTKLATQVRRMEAGGPAMGMVYSWWVRIDETGQIRGSSFPCRAEGSVALRLLYANFIGNASVPLYRRDAVLEAGGYDASLHARGAQGCEDWDLSLRVAARHTTGVAPGHLVGYRRGMITMSSDVSTMARSYAEVVAGFRRDWPSAPPDVFRWSEANFATYLASQSYSVGRYRDAAHWVWHTLRTDRVYVLAPFVYRLLIRSLARIGGGRWLDRALTSRSPALSVYTRDEIDAKWADSRSTAPWSSSWRPFDAVRTRRWNRLEATQLGAPSTGAVRQPARTPLAADTHV